MKNKVLFISSTHGNESFSIPVLESIQKEYSKDKYNYDWIIGNEEAVRKEVRFIKRDLNRVAPGNLRSTIYEEKRAAEIINLSQEYDYVIDIHGTKSDFGIVAVVPYPSWSNLVLSTLLPVEKIVIWYAKESGTEGPIVQHTKCPAVELECGPKNNQETSNILGNLIKEFLEKKDSLSIREVLELASKKEFYMVYGKVVSDHDEALIDFNQMSIGNEKFYPFMGNKEYNGITCYKMKKLDIQDLLVY